MFGVVISGRPILTSFETISPTQAQLIIPSTPAFGHIVVFMLPGVTLPEGQSAAIYIRVPPSNEFRLWGYIGAGKESTIFKIRDTAAFKGVGGVGALDDDAMVDEDASNTVAGGGGATEPITLGISIEPTQQVLSVLAAQKASQSSLSPNTNITSSSTGLELVRRPPLGGPSPVSTKVLAQRIIANAFNFLASFSSGGTGGHEVVPLKSFEEWWRKFEKRVERDPGFLERGDV
jgi:hypothetical protein